MADLDQADHLRQAVRGALVIATGSGKTWIPTTCIYPSRGVVRLDVLFGRHSCRLTDAGGALRAISEHGVELATPESFRRLAGSLARKSGLVVGDGVLGTETLEFDQVAGAAIALANASAAVAAAGILRARKRVTDVHKDLAGMVDAALRPSTSVHENIKLEGASARQYKFEYVADLSGGRQLILDAVVPDAQAINARVVAHLDLKAAASQRRVQAIVFDDGHDWKSTDLNLLSMAAIPVPLSRAENFLSKQAA